MIFDDLGYPDHKQYESMGSSTLLGSICYHMEDYDFNLKDVLD
jgi:hypothetical protein